MKFVEDKENFLEHDDKISPFFQKNEKKNGGEFEHTLFNFYFVVVEKGVVAIWVGNKSLGYFVNPIQTEILGDSVCPNPKVVVVVLVVL